MIYLACPYTHSDHHVVYQRMKRLTEFWLRVVKEGHNVIPLVALGHYAELMHTHLSPGYERWMELDFALIDACDEVWVLMLDHWENSLGVQREIAYALDHRKPVRYLDESESI